MRLDDLVYGLSVLGTLLALAALVAVLWFILAVGIPLRTWLRRELAKGESRITL